MNRPAASGVPGALFDSPGAPLLDEDLRQALLLSMGICGTAAEAGLAGLAAAAAALAGCPMALLGLFNHGRPAYRAHHGLADDPALQATLLALCAACSGGEHDGATLRGHGLHYLASEPLRLEGVVIGVLCVADPSPRTGPAALPPLALRGLADAAEALFAASRPVGDAQPLTQRRRQALLVRATHEMRTPLNAILGFAQLLQTEPELRASRGLAWLLHIENASHHLLALVERSLHLAHQTALVTPADDGLGAAESLENLRQVLPP